MKISDKLDFDVLNLCVKASNQLHAICMLQSYINKKKKKKKETIIALLIQILIMIHFCDILVPKKSKNKIEKKSRKVPLGFLKDY